jgi:hypothetical protein
MSSTDPHVSIVVVLRASTEHGDDSLHSLSAHHQRHVESEDYEIVIVEEGPLPAFGRERATAHGDNVRHFHAPEGASLDFLLERTRASLVGFVGVGPHLVTPRLVEHLLHAKKVSECPAVFVPEYRIGGGEKETAAALLATVDWRRNGYALFDIGGFRDDAYGGFFGTTAATNTVFLSKEAWRGTPTARPVLLAGEGVFRIGAPDTLPFAPSSVKLLEAPLIIGVVPPEGQGFLKRSARLEHERHLAPKRPVDASDPLARARIRYVELLERSLLGITQLDDELRVRYLLQCVEGKATFDRAVVHDIWKHEPSEAMRFAVSKALGAVLDGSLDHLGFDHTMIGRRRLQNIEECFHSILRDDVPGDLMECGVWRGGAVVLMRGLLETYEVPGRLVWVADSFRGLPPSTLPEDVLQGDLSRESHPMLAVDLDTVKHTFELHGLLDDRVKFLPGWFKDTLETAPIERLALLRLDGDLYESTRDALVALYDKLSPGGYLIVDDLFLPACRKAVDDFRTARGITEPIIAIDWTGGYWRKAQ